MAKYAPRLSHYRHVNGKKQLSYSIWPPGLNYHEFILSASLVRLINSGLIKKLRGSSGGARERGKILFHATLLPAEFPSARAREEEAICFLYSGEVGGCDFVKISTRYPQQSSIIHSDDHITSRHFTLPRIIYYTLTRNSRFPRE